MLKLDNIKKIYQIGKEGDKDYQCVEALKGVSVSFRKTEFVAILGQSGCGKTTMLNIIGGLDQYSDGDLIINGVSTKEYEDCDWDNYRNHKIGFVFQSYNLIPHQTVLENVELALTLSGVNKNERRKRAKDALTRVGLQDKINVKPTQLSGGQMQRVAIARAIVNDPDIILADEPTGALDTHTSVQIMDLLKEISKEKLIIMVTHNPDLAKEYATRTIKLLDGLIIDDTNPYSYDETYDEEFDEDDTKTNMSFFTALSLSGKNLLTKKARTALVSFAGSIGIIGISLILSLSNGFQNYINDVQRDTLSTYPLTITKESIDYSSVVELMLNQGEDAITDGSDGRVHANSVMIELFNGVLQGSSTNNLAEFKKHVDENEAFDEFIVKYNYSVSLNVYDESNESLNPMHVFTDLLAEIIRASNEKEGTNIDPSFMSGQVSMLNTATFSEMLDSPELIKAQYDLVGEEYGSRWPSNYDEAILVINDDYTLNDYQLYATGLSKDPTLKEIAHGIVYQGDEYELQLQPVNFTKILDTKYRILLNSDYYLENTETGLYQNKRGDADFIASQLEKDDVGIDLKIVGIVKPNSASAAHSIGSTIGYMPSLTTEIIRRNNASDIVKEQIAKPDIDILTGSPFLKDVNDVDKQIEELNKVFDNMSHEELVNMVKSTDNPLFISLFEAYFDDESGTTLRIALKGFVSSNPEMGTMFYNAIKASAGSYSKNLSSFGYVDETSPNSISFYCNDFETKDRLKSLIDDYNKQMKEIHANDEDGGESYLITYTDLVDTMMSSVSTIIDAISYVLIAFVSVSLVVSSIMIGIITYISVLERTKEIGVLRSIGASKKDIKRVFTAESLIIGLMAGVIGIVTTLVLNIPINFIIEALAGIGGVAKLPLAGALLLIGLSCFLTYIAGLFPSQVASKKDPVIALRSE